MRCHGSALLSVPATTGEQHRVPLRSHTSSTGRYRQPGGLNVQCRVHVPIVRRVATGTRPRANVQRHRPGKPAAGRTRFGRGEPPVNCDHFAAIPFSFVLQHGAQIAPRDIADHTSKLPVPHHVPHLKVLDHDRLVFTNKSSSDLVQVIFPAIGDPRMYPGYLPPSFIPIVAALLLAGQFPLSLRQPFPVLTLVFRVSDLLARRQSDQRVQPCIHTDHTVSRWQVLGTSLDQDRHEPSVCCIAGHRDRRWVSPFGQWTRPHNVEWFTHLRQRQRSITPPEPGLGVLGRLARFLSRFELWVLRSFGEEVRERGLQVPQRLLQRHAGHLTEIRQLPGTFPLGSVSNADVSA